MTEQQATPACILSPMLDGWAGFYCDHCGEPATAIARFYYEKQERHLLSVACDEHRSDPLFLHELIHGGAE